ncbi:hypothetical protein PAXRUDRAFT_826590 [Paxillus rubicundulus Ve08.2h10]|uniref:Unplaced genomic scaffold scaffold_195, whole genome shotgun sequence n=1 Tax=Paxillus rubicundulus Ve08.2h10 TaxID=930991 RepID=A0A0D0DZD3_9AGAM|nr:hypothetical protein PAXRUDRAFT_826590 [Paxillus rubicundulus Ve08.2h10]
MKLAFFLLWYSFQEGYLHVYGACMHKDWGTRRLVRGARLACLGHCSSAILEGLDLSSEGQRLHSTSGSTIRALLDPKVGNAGGGGVTGAMLQWTAPSA